MQHRSVMFGVSAVVFAISLAGCAVRPPSGVPSPGATVVASASATATVPQPGEFPLGPDGYGGARLGMTKADVVATGIATGTSGSQGTCGAADDGRLAGALPADQDDLEGKLFFSATTGKLVIISAMAGVATPEGVHLGSSAKDVKKAYPKWKGSEGNQGLGFIKVPGNAKAYYRLYIDADQVLELTLQAFDQDCTE